MSDDPRARWRLSLRMWLTATHLAVLAVPLGILLAGGMLRDELIRLTTLDVPARAPLIASLAARDLERARATDGDASLHTLGADYLDFAATSHDDSYPLDVWLVATDGRVVADNTEAPFPDGDPTVAEALAGRTAVHAEADPDETLVERMMRMYLPPGRVTATVPVITGEQVVGAVVTSRGPYPALQAVLESLPLTLLLPGLIALTTVLLAVVVADRVTRSIRVLTDEATRVADGELELAQALGPPAVSRVREVHQLAWAVSRMGARLDARLRMAGDVANAVAHELRTPLSTLVGTVELLEDPDMSVEDRRTFLARASTQLDRLRHTVDGVLALARAERTGPRESVDLDALAASLVDDDVTTEGHAGEVVGDPAALRLALDNLVRNARRHGRPPIRIVGWQRDDAAGWDVVDAGDGPPDDVRARLFERFVTGDKARGIGLGLAMVRAVADAHGGAATLEPGPETRLRVSLPRRR